MPELSEVDVARIGSLGSDTPPRGVKIELEEGLARMKILGAYPGIIDFMRNRPLLVSSQTDIEVFYGRRTGTRFDECITYDVRVLYGADKFLRGVYSWTMFAHQGWSYQEFSLGFFTADDWVKALARAEFDTQLEEPNPRIKSGESFWKQLAGVRHMFKKYWASDMYAEPRAGDILPVIRIRPNLATARIDLSYKDDGVNRAAYISKYSNGPESQMIRPFILSFERSLRRYQPLGKAKFR